MYKIEVDKNERLTGSWTDVGGNDDWIKVDSLPPSEPYYYWKYIDGKYVYDSEYAGAMEVIANAEEKIMELKQFLSSTDYVAIKIAEGEATKEEYSDVLADRKEARKRINELEEESEKARKNLK